MGQPNVKEQITAGPLANVSVAYRNKEYIADEVFPILDGSDPRAKITKFKKGAWYRDEAGIRAPGTEAKRGGYALESVSIATSEYAFAKEVTDEDRRFAKVKGAPTVDPDIDALEFAADKVDLKKERRVAAAVTGATWLDGSAGGQDVEGLWSPKGSTNTFISDMAIATKALRALGIIPTDLVLDFATYMALKECESILEKIKYTQRGVLTKDLLAAILDLKRIHIGAAIFSDAEETASGDDFNAVDIWTVNAGKGMGFLYHRPPKIKKKMIAAGLQARIAYENGLPRRTSTWREASKHQDVYEVAEETDIVVICSDAGFLFKDTYAT